MLNELEKIKWKDKKSYFNRIGIGVK
jgi:hypothetical protein